MKAAHFPKSWLEEDDANLPTLNCRQDLENYFHYPHRRGDYGQDERRLLIQIFGSENNELSLMYMYDSPESKIAREVHEIDLKVSVTDSIPVPSV